MKAVFVTYDSDNDVGGVSSWLRRLVPRLQAAGIEVEVHVLLLGHNPGPNTKWFQQHGVPLRMIPWGVDMSGTVNDCLVLAAESQPDVYVPNCILPAYYASGYLRNHGIRTIGVMHSDDPFYWGIVDEFVSGSSMFRLSTIVVVSKFLERSVKDLAHEHKVDVCRIPCGVPLSPHVAKREEAFFRLVYTGRLVEEQKRISDVTRALSTVVLTQAGVEAWIVGDGSARQNVERIIASSGAAPEKLKLVGRVEPSDIYAVLSQCHAFVLLSDYEGLPVSMLEAMTAGVVPVCLDMRSGIRDVVTSGVNGLIVSNRTDSFTDAVVALQNNSRMWTTLSANARLTVEEGFSDERCAAAWIELLDSMQVRRQVSSFEPPASIHLPRRNRKFGEHDPRGLGRWRSRVQAVRRRVPFLRK